jgi:beta-mannanase
VQLVVSIIVKRINKMKMPKNWNKLNISEQESWLVKKYQEMISEVESVSKMLAKIRGGNRIVVKEIERPDEALLKS